MGKLIVTEFMTLDGIGQAPGGPGEDPEGGFQYGGWQAPFVDAEAGGVMFDRAKDVDALLLGRRTYEIFAGYWPSAPAELGFTRLLNRIPKYVATRTLQLTHSRVFPKGSLQLEYEWAGAPTVGDLSKP